MLADLTNLLKQRELDDEEILFAVGDLLNISVSDEEKATFLEAWAQRGETAGELAACAEALLPQAVDPGLSGSLNGAPLLDCCGTGGGGLNLINISTGLMFVLAAIGIPVVKRFFLRPPTTSPSRRWQRRGGISPPRVIGPFSICSARCSIRPGPIHDWSAFSKASTSRSTITPCAG
jgi:hypothetical protein